MLVDLDNTVNLWFDFNVDFPIYGKGILVHIDDWNLAYYGITASVFEMSQSVK